MAVDVEQLITAMRDFAGEMVEAYASNIRNASDPNQEWVETVAKISLLAKDASSVWFCILPKSGSAAKNAGLQCIQTDPSTCLNVYMGTPTTSCPPSADPKLDD